VTAIVTGGERHVYRPLHSFPNSRGIGFGPCQYPGCIAEKNSPVHGALDLGITRKDPDHGQSEPG
jgi:hypothetical protein